jgi:hypothetical protein
MNCAITGVNKFSREVERAGTGRLDSIVALERASRNPHFISTSRILVFSLVSLNYLTGPRWVLCTRTMRPILAPLTTPPTMPLRKDSC